MAKNARCIAHRYRPSAGLCKACGKGICEECVRLHANLCPSCANMPGGNASRQPPGQKKGKGSDHKPSWGSPFSAFRLHASIKGKAGIVGAGILCATLVLLVVLGAAGMGPFPFRSKKLASADADRVVRQNLYFTVTAISAFKKRTGTLPKTLDEIGMGQDSTLSYQPVSKERFVLSQTKYGKSISYDSGSTPSSFFADLAPPTNPSVGEAKAPAAK